MTPKYARRRAAVSSVNLPLARASEINYLSNQSNMARPTRIGSSGIMAAAVSALKEHGAASLTLETVAATARCAKGLVHYHFATRRGLLTSVNDVLWDRREHAWVAALAGATLDDCVRQSWTVLSAERTDGTTRAWLSLLVDSDRSVAQAATRRLRRFNVSLYQASLRLLDSLVLTPTIPPEEWGRMLSAVIHGMCVQAEAGGAPSEQESDYAALWLAALSLTRPRAD